MRFCQQCSRLQPLEMFSGDRRSCAASLDKREWAWGLWVQAGSAAACLCFGLVASRVVLRVCGKVLVHGNRCNSAARLVGFVPARTTVEDD